MYGEELLSFDDVKKVFTNFISQGINENGVKVLFFILHTSIYY